MMRKHDKRVKVNCVVTKKLLIAMQKRFKTDEMIGLFLGGVTRQAVHQMRNKFGVPSLRAANIDRNKEILRQAKAGECKLYLAGKFKMSVTSIYRICRGEQ